MQQMNGQVGMAGTYNTHGQTRKDNRDTQNARTCMGRGGIREHRDVQWIRTDMGWEQGAGTHNIHGQTRRDSRDIQYAGNGHEGPAVSSYGKGGETQYMTVLCAVTFL